MRYRHAAILCLILLAGCWRPWRRSRPNVHHSKFSPYIVLALGIELRPEAEANRLLVFRLVEGGPAATAGVQSGDLLVALGGRPVTTELEVLKLLKGYRPGQNVQVEIERYDGVQQIPVVMHRFGPNALLGLELEDREDGVAITGIVGGSWAERSGVQPGDRLTHLHRQAVNSTYEVHRMLARFAPKQKILVGVERDGAALDLVIVLSWSRDTNLRNPPGWEGARDAGTPWYQKSNGRFGMGPGKGIWWKTVYPPNPDGGPPRAWINTMSSRALVPSMVSPERFGTDGVPRGAKPIDTDHFVRHGRAAFQVALGDESVWVQSDILFRNLEYATERIRVVEKDAKRDYILEIYTQAPGPDVKPHRSVLLGSRAKVFGNATRWNWVDPNSAVIFGGGGLWHPEWQVEGDELFSLRFVPHEVTLDEVVSLRPFPAVSISDYNRYLLGWKNRSLRKNKKALKKMLTRIEESILMAEQAGTPEYASRAKVLKAILDEVKRKDY